MYNCVLTAERAIFHKADHISRSVIHVETLHGVSTVDISAFTHRLRQPRRRTISFLNDIIVYTKCKLITQQSANNAQLSHKYIIYYT